ncbi:LLM class F420-dependent oxidoreductase [Promicromonospora thailandica]|uniref:F420-dependent oxidoreductase, Rv1855c family n=1 Tax=Promicromonospora thailandica TaxID=765201 RepID=A0A9X2G607_9MICO|nr:LLM class F420-dependent oxidoreductase [Promicromonospora thailandica]MCP2266348.1 putative F420-dependent oxidoreductase, Rv1855c family [Promicromonospora thailandica]BFF20023.1 LLM class F420-dependent oxidoreductase [Promicromonospora thailandica]
MTLDLRIFIEPQQGATYDDQLAVAQATERLGFSAFFRSDHYLAMGREGLPGPTDSWLTLAGIARETSTVRLGTLVSSATFRLPGVLAIQVAQVDQMSGGRVELGLGTGWYAAEHAAYGIPFPDKRFGILEEQLAVVTGLWGTPVGETFSFSGEHYQLVDSPALPKPAQQHIPLVVGGGGPRRTPALAARYGDEYNQSFPAISDIGPRIKVIEQALADAGREPGSMVQSVALVAAVGQDEAEFTRRAAAIGREPGELREHGIAGTVAEAVDRLKALEAEGVQRVYLQVLDLADLDHLDLFAREVRAQLG